MYAPHSAHLDDAVDVLPEVREPVEQRRREPLHERGAYPWASLSLSADIHLNMFNTSYDSMYL